MLYFCVVFYVLYKRVVCTLNFSVAYACCMMCYIACFFCVLYMLFEKKSMRCIAVLYFHVIYFMLYIRVIDFILYFTRVEFSCYTIFCVEILCNIFSVVFTVCGISVIYFPCVKNFTLKILCVIFYC